MNVSAKCRALALGIVICCANAPALANTGSLLVWAPIFHFFGNIFIGVVEAMAIRMIFRIRGNGIFGMFIIANFASLLIGAPLLRWFTGTFDQAFLGEVPLANALRLRIYHIPVLLHR